MPGQMLFHVLDAVLGSTAKVQLLRALIPLTSAVSGREAKKLAGARSDRGVREALRDLTELGVLRRENTRSAYLYRFNREHQLSPALEMLFEAESLRFGKLRELLHASLEAAELADRVKAVVLFGSVARGDARPDSDTDLLVVTGAEGDARPVRDTILETEGRIFARLGLRISPMVLPLARVRERYRDEDPLMKNIEAEGRVLSGPPVHELLEGR